MEDKKEYLICSFLECCDKVNPERVDSIADIEEEVILMDALLSDIDNLEELQIFINKKDGIVILINRKTDELLLKYENDEFILGKEV